MSSKIRLQRVGRKNFVCFRIVVTDRKNKQKGKVNEVIGSFFPKKSKGDQHLVVDKEKLNFWLKRGAQPSEAIRKLLSM